MVTLATITSAIRGASWVHDDRIIFGTLNGGLFGVSGEGGEPEQLTTPPDGESHSWPSAVPNGDVVLFTRSPVGQAARRGELAALSLDTGEVRTLGLAGTNPHYVRTGHLAFAVADGTMRAVPFDPDRLEVTGRPVTLVENIVVKGSGAADFDVLRCGTTGVHGGRPVRLRIATSDVGEPRWPGGADQRIDRRLLHSAHLARRHAGGRRPRGCRRCRHLILDLSRGTETKLTTDAFVEANPLWTPDGTGVVYGSFGDSEGGIFWKSADGTGEADRLMRIDAGTVVVGPSAWSADGTTLPFWLVNVSSDIGLLSVGGDGTPTPLIAEEFMEQVPAISPDGKWIAYESDESGQERRSTRNGSRDSASESPFPPMAAGSQSGPKTGRELFYRSADGMMAVPIDTSPTFRAGQPTLLFEDDYFFFLARRTYDVAPDGQRFLMITAGDAAAGARPFRMVVVEHWFEELKTRVPVP